MSRSVGHIPTIVGIHSFHWNLALQSLEQDVAPLRLTSNEPADAVREFVVELNVEHDTDGEGTVGDLAPSAREYLTKRHGTLDLDPMPSACDEDPYNWPRGKKLSVVFLTSFHCMVATLTMTALIPAYSRVADEFETTVHDCTYLTLVQVIVLGVAPLTWGPLATVYGRRPVFLLSLIMSLIGNAACAVSPNYAALMFFRAFVAVFLSPANVLSSAVIKDIFFSTERARGVGLCTLMFSLGVPLGPLVFGFIAPRTGFRWILWVLVFLNGVQVIFHFFLGHETIFIRNFNTTEAATREKPKSFKPIDSKQVCHNDFLEPLAMAARPCAVLPYLAQSVVFLFGSIFLVVEIPLQLGDKFHLNPDQISLQYLGMVIGLVLAEPVGGLLSDVGMKLRRTTGEGNVAPPEFRLWLSYAGYCLILTGVPLFLVSIEDAVTGRWTVVPVVGTTIASGGHHIAIMTLATYALDRAADDAVSMGVLSSLLKHIIAFIGLLWYCELALCHKEYSRLTIPVRFPTMIRNVGLKWSASIVYAIVILLGVLPTILVHVKGRHWR